MLLRRSRARHLLLGVLAAIGLLVMHGLSAHGLVHVHTAAASIDPPPATSHHATPTEHESAGSHHAMPTEHDPAGSHHGAPAEPTRKGLHIHLVALCVAVLLTVLAAIAIRSGPRLLRSLSASMRTGVSGLVTPPPTADRLLQLCVARC